MATKDISPETLRSLLRYDPETGDLVWRPRPRAYFPTNRAWGQWNGRFAGKPAITAKRPDGYKTGNVLRIDVYAHRVAWAIHYGEWPDVIDHINGDPSDNRLSNLRSVSQSENCRNAAINKRNKSGTPGVYWARRENKWIARIQCAGIVKRIGAYSSKDEARKARMLANETYGFHENHGREARS